MMYGRGHQIIDALIRYVVVVPGIFIKNCPKLTFDLHNAEF